MAELAGRIARGDLPPDRRLTVESAAAQLGVTRPVARDALLILHQKGLVHLQARSGATVQPLTEWDLLDPDVIDWRLQAAPDNQMRSLTELREMIEPWAARQAATRQSATICHNLIGLANELNDQSRAPDFELPVEGAESRQKFAEIDRKFHRTLLAGSGNELLASLADPVAMALDYRIAQDWAGLHPRFGKLPMTASVGTIKPYPVRPQPLAMWLHVGLAHAIDQGQVAAAGAFAEAILAEIRHDRLHDRDVRRRLREGLSQFRATGLRPADEKPFAEAMSEILRRHIPIVVMGVTGSAIGKLLAASMDSSHVEGDDLHAPRNRAAMLQGEPLDDRDCGPWLARIARRIADTDPDDGLVVNCSALKRIYREVLRAADPNTLFVHLALDPATASARVATRQAQFMPASAIASQFAALDELEPDENGLTLDATMPKVQLVAAIQAHLGALRMLESEQMARPTPDTEDPGGRRQRASHED